MLQINDAARKIGENSDLRTSQSENGVREVTYRFRDVARCNMCDAPAEQFSVMGKRLNRGQGILPKRKTGITTSVVRCTQCGLIFANPLPIPERIEDHYGLAPADYWSPEYFNVEDDYFRRQLQAFERLGTADSNVTQRRALDVGAGIGKCMRALERAGLDAFGIEPSPTFHRMAVEKMGISESRLQQKPIESAVFGEERFDFISFGAVLEHLYDPAGSLQLAAEWLRPGGLIYVEVPSARWLVARLVNLLYRIGGHDYVANVSPMHPPYHLYEFTMQAFECLAARCHLEIADHQYFVCQTYMPQILDHLLQYAMRWTNTGMQLEVWLRKPA